MLESVGKYFAGLAFDEVMAAIVLAAVVQCAGWFFLWVAGKDKKIAKGKRWSLILVSSILLVLVSLLCISCVKYLNTQVAEIRRGVTSGGGASAIRGSIYRCMMVENTAPSEGGVLALFNVRLTNPGRASTAWGWTARMTLTGKQVYEYGAIDLRVAASKQLGTNATDSVTNSPPSGIVLTPENYLPEALLERTVGPERGASGWVGFYIHNVPKSEIKPGTKFTIEFEQGDGTRRTIDHVWIPPN